MGPVPAMGRRAAGKGGGAVEHGGKRAWGAIGMTMLGVTVAAVLAVALTVPASAGAEDVADGLARRLGPSDWGHSSRVIGLTETAGSELIVSIWAAEMSTAEGFRARILNDVWLTMEEAFGVMPAPLRVTVSVFYPGRQSGNMQPLVVGHVRLSRDGFRTLQEREFPAEGLADAADTALIYVPPAL